MTKYKCDTWLNINTVMNIITHFLFTCSCALRSCCSDRGSWSGYIALKRLVISSHAVFFFSWIPRTEDLLFKTFSCFKMSRKSTTRWFSESGRACSFLELAIVNIVITKLNICYASRFVIVKFKRTFYSSALLITISLTIYIVHERLLICHKILHNIQMIDYKTEV